MERITVYICRHCGKVAVLREQPALHPSLKPLSQIECHTDGCPNWMNTVYTADSYLVSQGYFAVTVDVSELPNLIEKIEQPWLK